MTPETSAIIRLIKVLAHPKTGISFTFKVDGILWEGIRIYKSTYEIFREFPIELRDLYSLEDDVQDVLFAEELSQEEELEIKEILEKILIGE